MQEESLWRGGGASLKFTSATKIRLVESAAPKRESCAVSLSRVFRWSTILSGGNGSGKMSVHERTDIEYQRTEPVTDLERGVGEILVDAEGNAYFSENYNGLPKYDPKTNAVSILSHTLPNILRTSAPETASGWIYGVTGQGGLVVFSGLTQSKTGQKHWPE